MVVSFIGSLPLGTLNIAAMQISVSDGVMAAMLFCVGSLLVEIIYVRISLVAMDWIRKQEKLLKALEWVTLLCCKPGANSFLVRLEYRFVYQKSTAAKK